MTPASRTLQIFVSSTFNDLVAERAALQARVFPRLRALCLERGARFQAIDLRWGISREAGREQLTMQICLGKVERCRKVSPRPNFILLLGDRYGRRPLPAQIPAHEFEQILGRVSDPERELLLWTEAQPAGRKGWYRRDDNAVPPVYCLQPRNLDVPDDLSDVEREAALQQADQAWRAVEPQLREILQRAGDSLGLEFQDRLKYEASATDAARTGLASRSRGRCSACSSRPAEGGGGRA